MLQVAPDIPDEFALYPAYPNPFNSTTTVQYSIPYATDVSLGIYDPLGQRVMTLWDGYTQAGNYSTLLNADKLPTGIYFIELEANGVQNTRKITFTK